MVAGRSVPQLLVDPIFGRFFFGRLVSASAVWGQNIAAAIVMWDLTGSSLLVGAVSVSQFAGPILLAPWSGKLTDTFDRRRILLGSRLLSAGAAGVLAILAASDAGVTPTLLVLATFAMGIGLALSVPPMQALLPALVPRNDLDQAIALNSVVGNIARAVGPGLGSGLLLLAGPPAAFAASSLGHLIFAATLLGLTPTTGRSASAGKLLDGFRYLAADRKMALLIVGVGAIGLGVDPILTLTPALATDLMLGGSAVGVLASIFGVGAVSAAFAMRGLRTLASLPRLGFFGFVVMSVGLTVVATFPFYAMSILGFALTGAGFLVGTTALTTRIQRRVPDALRGRVMALWSVAFLGSRPVAAAFNGTVADLTTVRTALLVAAFLALAASPLALVRYRDGPT